jgi:hypothetical protein
VAPFDTRLIAIALLLGAVTAASPAAGAEPDAATTPDRPLTGLLSPEAFHAVADLRLVGADGEPSFTRGGFGKARYGGDGSGYASRADLAEASVEWRPRLGWDWSAVVDAGYQSAGEHRIGLIQAYVVYKPVPRSATSVSARIGYFYPQISLEHDAPIWGVTDTITPSALDSWVGEEVKVLGAEATVSGAVNGGRVSVTGALFGYDDTSGTLLTYRGWALDDLKPTFGGAFALPPLSHFAGRLQPPETYTTREVDHRLGGYARLEWRGDGPLDLHLFHYDNRGDRLGVDSERQWAWETVFTEAGAELRLDDRTRLLAQAMTGRTRYGFETRHGLVADVGFHAAYLRLSRDFGMSTLTGRIHVFSVSDHSLKIIDNNDEHGWALTGAWRRPLGDHADLRIEALHVWSDRPSRALAGLAPEQSQTVLQSSLRFTY